MTSGGGDASWELLQPHLRFGNHLGNRAVDVRRRLEEYFDDRDAVQ